MEEGPDQYAWIFMMTTALLPVILASLVYASVLCAADPAKTPNLRSFLTSVSWLSFMFKYERAIAL